MNYELAICFLFVLLFIIYFYIRKRPIIEGAGKSDPLGIKKFLNKIPKQIEKGTTKIIKDAGKKTKAEFDKAKNAATKVAKDAGRDAKKGVNMIKTELNKVKDTILKPIMKFAKQMMDFFKNLGRLFTDWANFINGNILCAIKNVSNPVCLLWNVIRLFGLMLYGFVWLIIVIFAGQSMADSFECFITGISDFLWKFRPKILATCGKGCSAEIPLWAGKKMRSPADKAKSKCNAKLKSKIEIEEENITSDRTFYWIVAGFLLAYKLDLPSIVQKWFNQPSNTVLNKTINPPSNTGLNETINPMLKRI